MNISISLTPEMVGLIKSEGESGRYASTSAVGREAPHLLERADAREADTLCDLRQAWNEGIASGDVVTLDFEALKAVARHENGKPIAK